MRELLVLYQRLHGIYLTLQLKIAGSDRVLCNLLHMRLTTGLLLGNSQLLSCSLGLLLCPFDASTRHACTQWAIVGHKEQLSHNTGQTSPPQWVQGGTQARRAN